MTGTPDEQRTSFEEDGFIHFPSVFTREETDELASDLDRLIQEWSFEAAWESEWASGPRTIPSLEASPTAGPV